MSEKGSQRSWCIIDIKGGDWAVVRVSSVGCRTHKWFVFSLQDSVEPDLHGLGCARLVLRVVFLEREQSQCQHEMGMFSYVFL